MIAHVAEAGEDRGRVVLQIGAERTSAVALEAAMRVATAFQSEVESVFVEDRQLYELARFPFVREIARSGQSSRELSHEDMIRELGVLGRALNRRVRALARTHEVALRTRVTRGDPVRALALACAASGPWNVVALASPLGAASPPLAELFDAVHEMTGIVVAGARARRTTGPAIAIVEDAEAMPPLMRAAERLAAATGEEARLLLVEDDAERLALLDGQVRLALRHNGGVRLDVAEPADAGVAAIAARLERARAGFVIARYGGRLIGGEEDLAILARGHAGPLFLVR